MEEKFNTGHVDFKVSLEKSTWKCFISVKVRKKVWVGDVVNELY